MNGIKQKLEKMTGHKPTRREYRDACRLLKKEAKRRLAAPGIMDRPAKWTIFRTIREIVKSARYILQVRKNQSRAYRQYERARRQAIKRHGGVA